MQEFNDIGISKILDFKRIKKLLLIGVIASIMHLAGDFLLGFGVQDESKNGLMRMFSAYVGSSDGRIFAAALLGLIGMSLEGLSMFAIYRLMAQQSPSHTHRYRSGIFGYIMFGACGFHVPVCAATFLLKHGFADDLLLKYVAYFIYPATILFFIFFLVLQITQISAFAKKLTPYPKSAWIFSMPVGMLIAVLFSFIGNYPFMNALFCGWIAFGSLWMFGGLLCTLKKVQLNYEK